MIPAVMPTYSRSELHFTHGEGSWLFEKDGRRFLDFTAGIAVNSLGHAHPELVDALTNQAQKLWHISNLHPVEAQENLAKLLAQLTFCDTAFFTNSGTEAAELAIKMARKWGGARQRILTFEGAFHGRSIAAISAAGAAKLTEGFGALLPGFEQLPWLDLEAVRAAAATGDAVAIMVEPVQGEGGIRAMTIAALRELREICDAYDMLLILDEVQSGVGRSGRLFAHEHAGIAPDIMMVAKGIGGGFPLGAVLATEDAAAPMTPGSHGSTYGGNPLACAVGLRLLSIVSEPAFLEDVAQKASQLHQGLAALTDTYPTVFTEQRGLGLMQGLKCGPSNAEVTGALRDYELLVVPAADNVIRLLPPLNITKEEIADALSRLDRAAQALAEKGA